MFKSLLAALTVGCLLTFNAHATSLTLTGPADAAIGDSFDLEIWGDFADTGLIAGGITLVYDAALVSLDLISLSPGVIPDFSCPGNPNCPPPTPGNSPIVWGEFLNDLITPNDLAPTLMATLTFTALGASTEGGLGGGIAMFDMLDLSELTGGWFGSEFTPIATPDLIGTSVRVIPLPAAAWFMIGGLASLLGLRRKQ